MYMIAVGQPLPGWSGPQPEGSQFAMNYLGTPSLTLMWPNPVPQERKALRKGKARVALVPAGDHTFFFLYNIEGLTEDWSDSSFSLGLLDPKNRELDQRDPNSGWAFTYLLADNITGIIHSMRYATVTPRFSQVLDDLIAKQRENLPQFTREAHLAEIQAVYKRHPSPKTMIKEAIITETIGLPFQKFGKHK